MTETCPIRFNHVRRKSIEDSWQKEDQVADGQIKKAGQLGETIEKNLALNCFTITLVLDKVSGINKSI